MKEFLLEIIFALVVVCCLYQVGGDQRTGIIDATLAGDVQTSAVAERSNLGVRISAAVFENTAPVAEFGADIPYPLPRLQRG